jgi:hypothetical protein
VDTYDAIDEEPLWGLALSEPDGPADHVDELLSSLLDIQDDICRAVTWLAENWSLALPKLAWVAGAEFEGDALRLSAACATRDELEVVADLFGVAIVAEGPADGWRWHHARRRFGTVLLNVFYGQHADDTAARNLAAYQAKCDEGPEAGAA